MRSAVNQTHLNLATMDASKTKISYQFLTFLTSPRQPKATRPSLISSPSPLRKNMTTFYMRMCIITSVKCFIPTTERISISLRSGQQNYIRIYIARLNSEERRKYAKMTILTQLWLKEINKQFNNVLAPLFQIHHKGAPWRIGINTRPKTSAPTSTSPVLLVQCTSVKQVRRVKQISCC